VNEPIPKLEAAAQTAGEAEYVNDIPERPGELHGAFVQTTQATGSIASIDESQALAIPGVVAFFKASDIPGTNNFVTFYPEVEEVCKSTKTNNAFGSLLNYYRFSAVGQLNMPVKSWASLLPRAACSLYKRLARSL